MCCSKSSQCIIDDDLMDIIKMIKECDILILASPVWHHAVTGLMKVFLGRLCASQLEFTVDNG